MSRRPDPVLSVVIPVWNGERYLAQAISSVLDQVGAPPMEVIVIDDGSDDGSAAVAERFGPPVRCIRLAHSGLAAARNAGRQIAQGDFLLHFDADDLLPPASIACRMAEFTGPAPADLVVGQLVSFISPELDAETAARYPVSAGSQRGGLPGATVARASFASRVGSFDTSRRHGADLDWMARAVEHGARVVEIPTVVVHRRIHGSNNSLAGARFDRDRLGIVRTALNRRRGIEEGSP